MNTHPQPDWSLLPQDPVRFLGLAHGFQLPDLKRAYGLLIKTYKPESHPEEFKRIRAAYESLEQSLRYGVSLGLSLSSREPAVGRWADEFAQAARIQFAVAEGPTDASLPTYQELLAKTVKQPQDYYLLAFLADLYVPDETEAFLKHLIRGLQQYPQDPVLRQLVAGYLNEDLALNHAQTFLTALAKVLPGQLFFPATEGLWLRLLRQPDFAPFRQCYEQCDRILGIGAAEARQAFLARILRLAVWQADPEWLNTQLKLLDTSGPSSTRHDENELSFLDALLDFKRNLPAQPSATERKIVELVRDYCTLDFQEGAGRVYASLAEIARDVTGLAASFPVSENHESFQRTIGLVEFIAGDVAEQTGSNNPGTSAKLLKQLAEATVIDLADDSAVAISRISRSWTWYNLFALLLTTFVGAGLTGLFFTAQTRQTAVIIAWFVLLGSYLIWGRTLIVQPFWERRLKQRLLTEYNRIWRPRLLRYVQSCQAPRATLLAELQTAARNLNHERELDLILSLSTYDPAIALLNLAQRFNR